jgi:hypothetical protein
LHERLTDSLFLANTDAEEIILSLRSEDVDTAAKNCIVASSVDNRSKQYPPHIPSSLIKGNKTNALPLVYTCVGGLDGNKIPIEETLAQRYFGKEARVTFFAKFQKMNDSRLLVSTAARPRRFLSREGEMRCFRNDDDLSESINDYGAEPIGSAESLNASRIFDGETVCSIVDHRFDQSDTLPSSDLLGMAMSRPVVEFFDDLRTLATREPAYRKLDADIMACNSFNVYRCLLPSQTSYTPRSSSTWSAGNADEITASSRGTSSSAVQATTSSLPFVNPQQRELAQNRNQQQRQDVKLPVLSPRVRGSPTSKTSAVNKLSSLDIQLEAMRTKGRQRSPASAVATTLWSSLDRPSVGLAPHIVAGGEFECNAATGSSLPPSPRTKYLSGCIRENIHPLVNLIVRKTMTSSLNWAHYGMGDVMGRVLADCIQDLPCVESINLNDNNLTDDSLQFLIHALTEIKTLRHLDLSRNKVDGESSDALADYLAREDCPLTKLTMQVSKNPV